MFGVQIGLKFSILIILLLFQLVKAQYQLDQIQVVFRHGDRTPLKPELMPKDIHGPKVYEKFGYGQLTNKGKLREYRLGLFLRKRYNTFLGPIYRSEDVHAVSTATDRTKMSLQLVLAGMYPPSGTQVWNPNLAWMPIPTSYNPKSIDNVMRPQSCPNFKVELEKVRNSDAVRKTTQLYKDLFKILSDNIGLQVPTPQHATAIYFLFQAQKSMDLPLPKWYTPVIAKRLQEVAGLTFDIYSFTPLLKRLNGGMLVKKFIENTNLDGKHESKKTRIFLYSGHDMNVASLSRAHDFKEPRVPDFGSAILMEKLRDNVGKIYVRLLLWSGVSEDLITYNIPQCGSICPVEQYLKLMQNIIPSEKESNCMWDRLSKQELRKLFE